MMKLTLALEGTSLELQRILKYLSEEQPTEIPPKVTAESSADKEPRGEQLVSNYWTEGKISAVWQDITLDCETVILEIAAHKDGISWEQLQTNLGLDAKQIGGRLSSLGHQIRIHGYSELPSPILMTPGYGRRLDPIWRQTITRIEEEKKRFLEDLERTVSESRPSEP